MEVKTNGTTINAKKSLWAKLGAGLITGAADDDPSGIATYSQVGAAYGYATIWSLFLAMPLMIAIQTISAHRARDGKRHWLKHAPSLSAERRLCADTLRGHSQRY